MKSSKKNLRTNHRIRVPKVQLIDATGSNIGVIETFKAKRMAEDEGMDLVEVAPSAKPPVCKIMDYGQYKYNQKKKKKQNKTRQQKTKDLRLRPNTAEHDINVVLKKSRKFLTKGDKVSIQVRFKGREMHHKERGAELLMDIINKLKDISKVESPIKMEGYAMRLLLSPEIPGE